MPSSSACSAASPRRAGAGRGPPAHGPGRVPWTCRGSPAPRTRPPGDARSSPPRRGSWAARRRRGLGRVAGPPLVLDGAEILRRRDRPRRSPRERHPGRRIRPARCRRTTACSPDLGALVAAATERRPDLVTVLAGRPRRARAGAIEALFRPDRPGPTVLARRPPRGDGEPLRELLDEPARRRARRPAGPRRRRRRRSPRCCSGASRWSRSASPGACRAVAACTAGTPGRSRVGDRPGRRPRCRPPSSDAHLDAVARLAHDPPGPAPRAGPPARAGARPLGGRGRRRRAAPAGRGRAAALGRLVAATPALRTRLRRRISSWRRAAPGASRRARPSRSRWPTSCGAPACGRSAWTTRGCSRRWGRSRTRTSGASIMADLRDDLLVPARQRRDAGRAARRAAPPATCPSTGPGGPAELDLVPGGLELVDLPPGERAVVEMRFRDPVDLGIRVKHAAVEVAGGLGGPPGGPAGRAAAAARPAGATARPAHGLAGGPVGRDRRMTGRDWLAEIPSRPLLERGLEARFPLPPGDRPLVEPGASLTAGDPLLVHLRDRRIEEVDVRPGAEGRRSPGRCSLVPTARAPPPRARGRRGAARPAARQARPLAAGHGRSSRSAGVPPRRRGDGGPARRGDPRAGRRAGAARRVRRGLRRAWSPGAGHRPVRRAAARRDRRRASRQHPRGRAPGSTPRR